MPSFPKFKQHSQVLAGSGSERIHVSVLNSGEPIDESAYPGTLYELLQYSVECYGNCHSIGEQIGDSYAWITYAEMARNANFVGSALRALGIAGGQTSRVGLAGLNSPRYLTASFGLISQSMVAVPLYHNYKLDAILEIVNHCELEAIFCDTTERAQQFVANAEALPTLRIVIVMRTNDICASDLLKSDPKQRIKILTWESLLKMGEAKSAPAIPPNPSDIYIICHTSGTTGKPKGVQLSHRALLAASVGGLYAQWCRPPHNFRIDTRDVYLSFLSPAHSYEQLMQTFIIFVGGRIGVFGGDVARLIADAKLLRPTVVALVPRLLDKFRTKILAEVRASNPILRRIFDYALKTKIQMLTDGKLRYNTVWDRFVFRRIHRLFGGRLRLVTTGGAPITRSTMLFSRAVYGCPVFEGYGQTECCAAGTLSLPADTGFGHVGGPSPWAQMKLADVSELGYSAVEDRGEICFRGPALMSGYYKDEALTAEVIDNEGWLHTGDIGEWLADGSLRIIDRKRHFLKLNQGDFVAPEQIESILSQHEAISQENLINASSAAATAQSEKDTRVSLLEDLWEFGAARGLSSLERIRNVHITADEFATDPELLTPTLKLKRAKVAAKFADVIEDLYVEGPLI